MIEILNTQDKNGYELMWGCYDILAKLPDDCTNGDVLRALFPNLQVVDVGFHRLVVIFGDYRNIMYRNSYDEDWWNAPYKTEAIS